METVADGLQRSDVKFLHRINKVSFAFSEQRNAKRSETIAKRSKTPLKKSNSMMVLRNIGMIELSAPSPVDVTSSDDVTYASCSIASSPVSTASSGKSRRRLLPSLPTQKTEQEINGASVNGGVKKAGLRRHESCAWPSRSGAVNHQSTDNVSRRSVDSVNHWRSNFLSCHFSNGENVNLPDNNVNQRPSDLVNQRPSDLVNQRPSDLVNQRPSDLVNYRQSDLVNQRSSNLVSQRPSDLVNQRPSDLVNQRPSELVNQRTSILVSQLPSNLVSHGPNDLVNYRQSDLINHGPSDTVTVSPSGREMKNYNTSQNVPLCLNGSVNHSSQRAGHLLAMKQIASKDEDVRREVINNCQNKVMNTSHCDSSDVCSYHQNDGCVPSPKNASVSLHNNSTQREVVTNRPVTLIGPRPYGSYPDEVISQFDKAKVNPRNSESDIHCSSDKFNQCPNVKDNENETAPRVSADYVTLNPKPSQKKLHFSASLGVKSSSPERRFQGSDGVRLKNVRLNSKHEAPSKASYSDDVVHIEASIVSKARPELSPAFLHTQANPLLSDLQASSVDDDDKENDIDFKVNHKTALTDIPASLQLDNTFQPQERVLPEAYLSVSKEHESPNYPHTQNQERSSNLQTLYENDQQSSQKPSQNPSPSSSDSFKNLQEPGTASKNQDTKSQKPSQNPSPSSSDSFKNLQEQGTASKNQDTRSLMHDAASHRKLSPLNSTNHGSHDNHRLPIFSKTHQSSSKDIHCKSLDTIPDPEYFLKTLTERSGRITDHNSFENAFGVGHQSTSITNGPENMTTPISESESFYAESYRSGLEQTGKYGSRGTTTATSPCVPTLHALLKTCRVTAVSLVRSTGMEDCGVTLTTVPFGVDMLTYRRPAGMAPRGKRAKILGSPDGAFRPVVAAETSPAREVQPQVVMVTCVEDGSVAAASGSIEEGDFVLEVNGTYVLGSSFDAVESLLTVNSQHLDLVLAKPIAQESQKSRPCGLDLAQFSMKGASSSRITQCQQEELASATHDQPPSKLEHVPSNCQQQRTSASNGIIIKPTTLAWPSNRSSETTYTIRPIKEETPSESTITGFNQAAAFHPRRDPYDKILDSDYEWQKISAV